MSKDHSSGRSILPENSLFKDVLGKSILLVLESPQLNLLGQTFRPIFCGEVVEVTNGYITLFPANIKMSNAPQFIFPTPLKFPVEHIALFTEFDCDTRISL
ncbi:MAG: hypothetical protein ACI35P_07250 [Bacillus sp. (in: firmicutes)]